MRNNASFGGGSFATNTQTQTGWTVGAGAEYALDRHLSVKVEYLYVDLGGRDISGPGNTFNAPGVPLFNASLKEQATANVVRAGLNYRF